MNKIKKLGLTASLLTCISLSHLAVAQETASTKSWEIALNGVATNWSRVTLSTLQPKAEGYHLNLDAQYLLGGVGLSIARELTPWLYADLQASMNIGRRAGTPRSYNLFGNSYDHAYLGGVGLQFRLTPLLKNKYIEPYFRLGVNYLYKDILDTRTGKFANDPTGESGWALSDPLNPTASATPTSKTTESLLPLSIGIGTKAWFNDHFGLGLQAEYLHPIQPRAPRFAQLTASIIWRIGGKSKAPTPVVTYVDRPVERIVERIVEVPVEKIVEKEVDTSLYALMEYVTFAFDSDRLEATSAPILDKIAALIKQHEGKRFLIIGMTDAKGSQSYNLGLSERRAKKVYQALVGRGVAEEQLKHIGLGKRAALIAPSGDNEARRGDRKVVIEWVTNESYWDSLPR